MIGLGLLDRIQILTLYVLDQRDLEHLLIVVLTHHRGNLLETREAGGAKATLTGHQLISVSAEPAHQHRLQHARGLDRGRQLADRFVVESNSRLKWIRSDHGDRKLAHSIVHLGGCDGARSWNEGVQPTAEHLPMHGSVPPAPDLDSSRRLCCWGRREQWAFQTREPRSGERSWESRCD